MAPGPPIPLAGMKRDPYISLMTTTGSVLLAIALAAVLGVLAMGLFSMARGGEFNRKYGNKFMQARVILQFGAIALLAIAVLFGRE